MYTTHRTRSQQLSALLATLLALLLLSSPLLQWWGGNLSPWYTPYLVWMGIIALTASLHLHRRRHVE